MNALDWLTALFFLIGLVALIGAITRHTRSLERCKGEIIELRQFLLRLQVTVLAQDQWIRLHRKNYEELLTLLASKNPDGKAPEHTRERL